MFSASRKYTLDSNVLIHAFRDRARNVELQRFRTAFAPFEYLSAVVVQELRAGAPSKRAEDHLQRHVFDLFERRGRVFAPSYAAWKRAGAALADLANLERTPLRAFGRSFVNDVLLAASCRESGIVLVTENVRDFARVQRVLPFEFVPLGG